MPPDSNETNEPIDSNLSSALPIDVRAKNHAIGRDLAIKKFLDTLTRFLLKCEPLVDEAIKGAKER